MYVCICYAVTEAEIVAEIDGGARTEDDIHERTMAGTGCGSCVDRISDLLAACGGCPRQALAGLGRTA